MTALNRIKEKISLLTKDPICDIEETNSHTLLSLDLPNLNVQDLEIYSSGKSLFIEVKRHHKCTTIPQQTKVIQCHHQQLSRQFNFPMNLNHESIDAYYQNGVLRIAVPKTSVISRNRVTIHIAPIGFFSNSLAKPTLEQSEPIESFSDIDDYDWE